MAINIKFTKFDNTPWGFRLAGGSDFPHPLTVIRVTEGGLAECMGLKVGDVVVRLNDQPISSLTHGEAHEALIQAGNNFVLGVQREEESRRAEAIQAENIAPYKPVELEPVHPEKILTEEPAVEEQEQPVEIKEEVPEVPEVKEEPQNSCEIAANQNLTDDEIAQLILEEEELLPDQGVLGVNFKKLRPRASILRESKVLQELQNIETAEPKKELRKFTSTFLQKPQRPIPTKPKEEVKEEPEESYRVVIKKQQKKSVTTRLLEQGLLNPESLRTPVTRSEATTPSATPDPGLKSDQEPEATSRPESQLETCPEKTEVDDTAREKTPCPEEETESRLEEAEGSNEDVRQEEPQATVEADKEKIQELVSTEISLEKQLENVQQQLIALKQLPSEIENHLRIVSEQLQKIMELSGVQNGGATSGRRSSPGEESVRCQTKQWTETRYEEEESEGVCKKSYYQEDIEMMQEERSSTAVSDEIPQIIEPSEEEIEEDEEAETKELEGTISVKSNDEEGSRVKKFIVSYETKLLKSRDSSPAPSHGSYEPDPNLSPKDQVIQELKERKGRKPSRDLWPQAKQLELTLGRRWRCPNDFFNDDMIAEVLCSQAEVIRGKAMGINFKKYEKTNLPNYDHLMNSSVYKMIHKMEKEPKKGIPARPPKVNAAEDIIERVKSPALSTDDRSTRSVSH